MINPTRTLVVLAGLAVLAAPSQAVITFSNYTSDFNVGPDNQISSTPPQLSNFPTGIGPVVDSGNFDVTTTFGLTELDVNEVDGFAYQGTVSLTVTMYDGPTNLSPVLTTLYSGTTNNIILPGVLLPLFQNNPFGTPLMGTYYVSYTATYVGQSPASLGYLGGFAVDAYEAVPEPAAYAALGIGVIGLLARGRRSRK